jgi:hypothetical protein
MNRLLMSISLVAVLLMSANASAATITLVAGDGWGTSSFNSGLNWSNGLAPSAGNDYQVSIQQLRTPPDGGNHTFGGDSLTINAGGIFMYKGTGASGSITVDNLVANGGNVIDHRNGSGDICNLYGNVSVIADSVMYAKQGPINVYSVVSGSSMITNPGSDGGGRTLTFYSSANTYTGSIVNNGRFALADDALLNFVIGASGVNNSVSGTGPETVFDGDFSFDLTGAGTGLGDSWVIASAASQVFGSTFTVIGFTDIGGDLWNSLANGVTYQFSKVTGTLTVIPEPATLALLGLGGLALLRRRR